ncbi:MAG: N-acetylglucosamine-6-phosphate deacetylase [Muribaculaceae bacterium]|nr:N-acetylglucosamine-6-phosphate deacetylase [Muribaculaceae bacterium]
MLTQIYNGQILTPSGWINDGSLLFEDSRIVEIRKNSNIEPRAETAINALGMYVVPGGIELHCHGGGGRDFMEGSADAFRTAVMAHRKHGTTSIFPTLSSASLSMIEAAAQVCDELIEDPFSGVLGLHLEGPYFNPQKAGAQMPELIRLPDPEEYHHVVEDFNCIKRWDSAPELPGAVDMGPYLTGKGVLPSIAHTAAEFDDVRSAYEAGYTHATHFYNGMPGFHNVREFKHAGTVEAVYLMENMTVEMIADGIHVPPTLLKLVYHMKGVERTALVTDALAVAASDSDKAFDPRVIIEDGVCKLADRSALAGSIATMDRLIATAVHMAEIPLQDACRMVAETPARIMGVYDRKGSLQRGKDADILLLDEDINLKAVYCMGNRVNLD